MAYTPKDQEFAYSFYSRGLSKERALREIRKCYPGFSGSTWDEWVERLDWKSRRAQADMKLREFEDLARDTAKVLLLELDLIRQRLKADIDKNGADTQTVYAYTSVAKQITEISRQHMASRDGDKVALEVLNRAFEKLLSELREIEGLGAALVANAARVGRAIERISEEFGREGSSA